MIRCSYIIRALLLLPLGLLWGGSFAFAQFGNGPHYINNTGSGPSDYTTIQSAINALIAQGVSGTAVQVVFDITGTYEESFTLPDLNNGGILVVFQGQGMNTTTIERLGTNSPSGVMIDINGARNVTFKDLFLRNVAGDAVVKMQGNTSTVSFQSVKFFGLNEDLLVSGHDINAIEVRNSRFEGQDNIRIAGNPASGGNSLKIHDNTFLPRSDLTAIKVSSYKNVEIYNNTITGGNVGMDLNISEANALVYNNQIYGSDTGILVSGVLPSGQLGLIGNNMIRAGSRGISFVNGSRYTVLHNTVQVGFFDFALCNIDPSSSSRAFNAEGALTADLTVHNNVFSNVLGGYSTYVGNQVPSNALTTDGNNLYNWGEKAIHWRGTDYETLFDFLQDGSTGTSEDNSVNCSPQLTAQDNFHSNGFCMDGAGVTGFTTFSALDTDLDGDARTNPGGPLDIGADEFTFSGSAPLSGAYTVGGSGARNYATIAAAVADLRLRGITSAVTIDVQPGTYSESNWFLPIDGATAGQRVTFTGDLITPSKITAAKPIKLCGRLYTTFESLTLETSQVSVDIPSLAKEVIFRNNTFTSTGTIQAHFMAEGGRLKNATINGNTFTGQYDDGIWLSTLQSSTLDGNTFTHTNPNFPSAVTSAVNILSGSDATIQGNTISNLSGGISGSFSGATQILSNQITTFSTALSITMQGNGASTLVANNMLHHTEKSGNAVIAGLENTAFYHNTVYLSGLTNLRNQAGVGGGVAFLMNGYIGASVHNNLFINEGGGETAEFQGVRHQDFASDNNLFHIQGGGTNLIRWITDGSASPLLFTDLATFRAHADTGTHESASISKAVTFVSGNDLHLSGSSIGDQDLAGTGGLAPAVTTDIDGDTRSTTKPYLGADEAATSLPVELAQFDAQRDGNAVILRWATASETNNAGFEVQTRTLLADSTASVWTALSFVEGHGTTLEAQTYTYTLSTLAPGTHRFRLKQVDYDGTFVYTPEVEVMLELVEAYILGAAYPNPFNPQTQFSLQVAQDQQVTIAAFDVMGRRVALLHAGDLTGQRQHTFAFDATNLASGLYMIRVVGERFTDTRRVTLVK